MFIWVRQLFTLPSFDTSGPQQTAALLRLILAVVLGIGGCSAIVLLAVTTGFVSQIVTFFGLILLMVLAASFLMQRGRVLQAAATFIGLAWLTLSLATLSFGGVRVHSFDGYEILVLLASLLLGERAGLGVAGISLLAGGGLLGAEVIGLLPPSTSAQSLVTTWTMQLIYFTITVTLLYLTIHSLNRTLGQTRHKEQDLAQINRQLEREISERQREIAARKQAEQERERLLEAEREQRLLAGTLTEVTLALTAKMELTILLDEILRQVRRLVPYDAANIMLKEDETLLFARGQGYDTLGNIELLSNFTQRLDEFPIDAEAVHSQRGVVVANTEQEPHWVSIEATAWIRSHLVIPIVLHGQVLGLIRLDSRRPCHFSGGDIHRLSPLASAAAVALENVRLHKQARQEIEERKQAEARRKRALQQQESLIDLAGMNFENVEARIRQLVAHDARMLHVERVSVWLINPLGTEINLETLYILTGDTYHQALCHTADEFPVYFQALRTGRPIVAGDARRDPRTAEFTAPLLDPFDVGAMLDVPIRIHGQVVGVLCHEHVGGTRAWSVDEQKYAASIADQVALALLRREQQQAAAALRESEEKFRVVTEQSLAGIMIFQDQQLIYANETVSDINGYSLEEMLTWSPGAYLDTIHPADRPFVLEQSRKKSTGQKSGVLNRYASRVITRDGQVKWVDLFSRTIQYRGRHAVLSTIVDITDRKEAEAEIYRLNAELEARVKQRTAELEAANRDLESFSYSVSHDLRAPLRHIDGFVRLLQKQSGDHLDGAARRYLRIITESVAKMGQLIDDLLAFSRTGRLEFVRRPVDLYDVVSKIKQDALAAEPDRSIIWQIGPLPVVEGDPALLGVVWNNLIANALKYSASRSHSHITIGQMPPAEEEAEAGMVTCFIRDNGVGFDPHYKHKLFGVFQRLHRDEEFEGTGIGLATVQRIIQRHGGQVWAEGAVDQGATFYITLKKVRTAHGE